MRYQDVIIKLYNGEISGSEFMLSYKILLSFKYSEEIYTFNLLLFLNNSDKIFQLIENHFIEFKKMLKEYLRSDNIFLEINISVKQRLLKFKEIRLFREKEKIINLTYKNEEISKIYNNNESEEQVTYAKRKLINEVKDPIKVNTANGNVSNNKKYEIINKLGTNIEVYVSSRKDDHKINSIEPNKLDSIKDIEDSKTIYLCDDNSKSDINENDISLIDTDGINVLNSTFEKKQEDKKNLIQTKENVISSKSKETHSNINNFQINKVSTKTIEDDKNKINSIIENNYDLIKCISYYIKDIQSLFNPHGFFIESKFISNLELESKLKLVSYVGKIYPFLYKAQKEQVLNKLNSQIFDIFNDRSVNRLKESIFFLKSTKLNKKNDFIQKCFKDFYSKVKIDDNEMFQIKTIEDVKELMQLFILGKGHNIFSKKIELKIALYLYLAVNDNPIFISDGSINELYIMKIFFEDFNVNQIKILNNRDIMYKDYNLTTLSINTIGDLFTASELTFCERFLKNIQKYFILPELNVKLLDFDTEFIDRIIELQIMKNVINPENFKKNLISLEMELYDNYKNSNLYCKSDDINTLNGNFIYSSQYSIYKKVYNMINYIRQKFMRDLKISDLEVRLIPFGSITQLLGSNSADLDLFIDITTFPADNLDLKRKFMDFCGQNLNAFKKNTNLTDIIYLVTNRLATVTFTLNNVKVDLNYFGVTGVLNSTLLRCYVLCDSRFSILAYNIKKLIEKINIKNTENDKNYLNSYTWMLILITYLQDIISPPVLPKILKDLPKQFLKLETFKKVKIDYKNNYHQKTRKKEMGELEYTEFIIRNNIEKEFENIYKNQIKVKNEMSLAELWIGFIEFFVFYLKADMIMIDTYQERFLNLNDYDYHKEKKFNLTYFKNQSDLITKDPFDHTYTPSKVSKATLKIMQEKLKEYYKDIIN